MAGVQKLRSRTWRGWYRDHTGKRRFFTLSKTASKRDTLQTAQDLETHHRKMALGVLPRPNPLAAQAARPIADVIAEYLQWGASREGSVVGPGVPSTSTIGHANYAGGA